MRDAPLLRWFTPDDDAAFHDADMRLLIDAERGADAYHYETDGAPPTADADVHADASAPMRDP